MQSIRNEFLGDVLKIGIIDADLISRKRHRFPNLACMKISSYYKKLGHDVRLLLSYNDVADYDKVFVSKAFTDTQVPDDIVCLPHVECGGTGFYYDKAPRLPYQIEHSMPDYHLYDDFINELLSRGASRSEFKWFLDYSIGFLTRGCFRKCAFCVNKGYSKVETHSQLREFLDPSRPKICLLDDNFFGYSDWENSLLELQATGKPFVFRQGLDERLLTNKKCNMLFGSRYDGPVVFAFDNVSDYQLIESKLQLIREHTDAEIKFYLLCAFESQDENDIDGVFVRIQLLMKYGCVPYIMRFEKYKDSQYSGMYTTLSRWCNQPSMFRKKSFREFCFDTVGQNNAAPKYAKEFEQKHPEIARKYFDMRWSDYNYIKGFGDL